MSVNALNSKVSVNDCGNVNVKNGVTRRRTKDCGPGKDTQILLKVSTAEKVYLQEIAASRGITLSKLIMDSVLHAVVS